ncbi:hypothetical protein [Flavihumibacter solisilvae]|uniref:Quinol oxidase subunit 4 n=1 Tax=Flavihumibacter solisilvae TaxID=1349421 RepID=A0A0C1L7A8_9BACT|nr:hypothetical protein [Flavihumibacter solisilvae]KIC96037.1 hypothetical protein OI18_02305 [Flavihumibacter solisilvae]
MTIRTVLATIAIASIAFTACTRKTVVIRDHHHHHSKPLPPGQAKKVYGSKSAKPYAPGQQKKHKHKHKD